jgi:peptidoglycan/xylan/chitin deacetylase (PgdA/CDA1 family)
MFYSRSDMMDERMRRADELEAEAERLRQDVADNPPHVVRTPYLIEDKPGEYRVGSKDEPQFGDYPYNGPCASIYADDGFAYVVTDEHEGVAMINREALPQLIEALQRLQTHLQKSTPE